MFWNKQKTVVEVELEYGAGVWSNQGNYFRWKTNLNGTKSLQQTNEHNQNMRRNMTGFSTTVDLIDMSAYGGGIAVWDELYLDKNNRYTPCNGSTELLFTW